eukprot:679824-Pyramimonas_sp.AAC.1
MGRHGGSGLRGDHSLIAYARGACIKIVAGVTLTSGRSWLLRRLVSLVGRGRGSLAGDALEVGVAVVGALVLLGRCAGIGVLGTLR